MPLATTLLLGDGRAAGAMVPYVYVPKAEELEGAGLGIARAAARLLQMGQVSQAAELAELTVQLLPDNPDGWALLAEAQLRSHAIDKALYALTRAKDLDPKNPRIWFAQGALALRNGNPQQAIPLLRKGLELDSKNAGAYFDLGNAQLLLNEPRTALASFERATQLRKNFWQAINNQALVLFELDNRPEAIQRWREVLKLQPNEAEPSLALAASLFAAGPLDPTESLELAASALDSEPNYVLDSYQKDQLWGDKLRQATRKLLAHPELKESVERAMANANSDPDQENGQDGEGNSEGE